ncbi:MAG: Uncharacterized protein AWU57_1432 [Marinobacter sp. T13-3]|mgnify:CR=1 FL=1|nr:MAG: Uncharacterized protein AWU57_1432 [Marinobacter sp. T13-3]
MFVTQNHTEALIGPPDSPYKFWHQVELSGEKLWFFVSTAYSRAGKRGRRCYMIEEPSDLVALVQQTGEHFWIEQVMIVTPPGINGTGNWQMSQLKELVAASDSSDLVSIDYIYQFTNDLCYATRDISEINAYSWHQILYSQELHAYRDGSDQ